MKYPKEYLDEIKLRLKVSQVVGKSVKLKKRGKEFIGLSPFSNEKTPSFTVNNEKGFYHCFSSAEHGNIFDFLMKTKNYKFGEAVRALASDAGMQPYRFTKQDDERQNRWKIYNSILEKYEIPQNEISTIKKIISKKENLNKLKKNQIIKFTLDLGNSKKIMKLLYPASRTKKIQLVRDLTNDKFEYQEIVTDLNKKIIYKEAKIFKSLYKSAINLKVITV